MAVRLPQRAQAALVCPQGSHSPCREPDAPKARSNPLQVHQNASVHGSGKFAEAPSLRGPKTLSIGASKPT